MGIALVMTTREPNIKFPRTAAALHSAFKKPKPVALKEKREFFLKKLNEIKILRGKGERRKWSTGLYTISENGKHLKRSKSFVQK